MAAVVSTLKGFGHMEVTESPARIDGGGDELVLAGARQELAAADSASSAPAGSERRKRSAEEMAGVDEWQVGGGSALPPHIPPTGALAPCSLLHFSSLAVPGSDLTVIEPGCDRQELRP